MKERLDSLYKLSKEEFFIKLIEIAKRVRNITKDFIKEEINENLLENKLETQLYNRIKELKQITNYDNLLLEVLNTQDLLNKFFDNVIVMSGNLEVRKNRLSLLKSLDEVINYVSNINLL